MQIRVLGCSGSSLGGERGVSFLIGDRVALDAGSVASGLDLAEQVQITDVFLTHAHLDHVMELPSLAENVFGRVAEPITVHATEEAIGSLRDHIFNGVVWPDFTNLPSEEAPILHYEPMAPGTPVRVGPLSITTIPVNHPGGSVGFLVEEDGGIVVFSGDTGPTEELWEEVNRRGDSVRAIILETSFPNRLQEIADVSGHLTPNTLRAELAKIEVDAPVYLHALKAPTAAETRAELTGLPIRYLEPGTTLDLPPGRGTESGSCP
jgi:ribonuclease BN (tRNA processing enzyme)